MRESLRRVRLVYNWDEVPELLEICHLVRILWISEQTVRALLVSGDIPAIRGEQGWRIKKEDLLTYLNVATE